VGFVIGLVLAHHQQLNLIQIQQFGTKNIYIHLAASQNGGHAVTQTMKKNRRPTTS
jgi:hypothetical protein